MKLPTILLLWFIAQVAGAQVTLLSTGSVWKYLANGLDQGTAWQTNDFDDASWPSGTAQFGWGDGDESTVLFVGNNPDESPITTYYRSSFFLTDRLSINTLTLRVLRDDGVIIYINGSEVVRNNMPDDVVDFQTFALTSIDTNENRYVQYGVFAGVIVDGTNTVAVEIHQSESGREDCGFDFEMIANIGYQRPRLTVLTPAHGTTVDSNLVSFTADASDADGHVVGVEYYVGGQLIGAASEPPFQLEALFDDGRYSLRAIAYDNHGFSTESPTTFFQIGGEFPVYLLRAPYLQSGSSTSLVVRWRTDWPTNSVVRFGLGPDNLNFSVSDEGRTSEHEVLIHGLLPDTAYYYEIGSASQTFAGGDEFVFHTTPTNTRPVSVWVIGDSGTANENAAAVRDSYIDTLGPPNTDLWLMLGDNAYGIGTDDEYQAAVFEMYPEILQRVVLWPTVGNHDAASPGLPGEYPYLDIFTLPTNGEAGGVPSGTEKYYSFDYANIHFVCLDSQSSDRAVNGPMLNWLREDLAATEKDWIVAYWHHPPYSKGTHDSDTEFQLIEMRERALPVLEAYGADLVLCGHSHVYERSYLLNGHYGPTNSFQPLMVIDGTLGQGDQSPYRKPAGGLGAHQGAVYAVCGCSGQGGPNNFFFGMHPAMAQSLSGFGSMILRFDGLQLSAQFLGADGATNDYFTIDKSQPTAVQPRLDLIRSVDAALLSWPTSNPTYALETSSSVGMGEAWQGATNTVSRIGRRNLVNVGFENTNGFYRLRAGP